MAIYDDTLLYGLEESFWHFIRGFSKRMKGR